MTRTIMILASIAVLFLGGCNEKVNQAAFKQEQPTVITEPAGVRPRYHWRQGHWRWNRKQKMHVWEQGQWVNRRKHTKWVEGHWVETRRGKKYMEGHWE
ncbi:MAG TPA: hypothetical protein VFE50_21215 [Cyclobacteriaceae bacterium]|nr:hypothetical protein [Cyclobacteriaceae bacterium]